MSLLHFPAPVQAIAFVALPERAPSAEPEYTPTPEDLAYDTGYSVALEGGRFVAPSTWDAARCLNLALGRRDGERAHEAAAARELGEALGYQEGPPEPPAGLADHEARAFRAGYAEGLARWEGERAEDAHYDSIAALYAEDPITDADVYPLGCWS